MSAKEYERIWRETNAETASVPPYKRDAAWNRIFERKVRKARKEAAA